LNSRRRRRVVRTCHALRTWQSAGQAVAQSWWNVLSVDGADTFRRNWHPRRARALKGHAGLVAERAGLEGIVRATAFTIAAADHSTAAFLWAAIRRDLRRRAPAPPRS